MKELKCDILIVGAGLTGLMTAYTLASLKKNIILIDKFDFDKEKQKKAEQQIINNATAEMKRMLAMKTFNINTTDSSY